MTSCAMSTATQGAPVTTCDTISPHVPVPLMAIAKDDAMALAVAVSPCDDAKATAMATDATVFLAPWTSPALSWLAVAVAKALAAACVLPTEAARVNAAAFAATLPCALCVENG